MTLISSKYIHFWTNRTFHTTALSNLRRINMNNHRFMNLKEILNEA